MGFALFAKKLTPDQSAAVDYLKNQRWHLNADNKIGPKEVTLTYWTYDYSKLERELRMVGAWDTKSPPTTLDLTDGRTESTVILTKYAARRLDEVGAVNLPGLRSGRIR